MGKRYPQMTDKDYNEWKQKLSIAHKNKVPWNKGKILSKSHCKKLSESHKGYIMPKEQKEKISKSCSKTWNLPEMKELNSKIQRERFSKGEHNFIDIIKIRQKNARINEYDLKQSEWKQLRHKRKEIDNYECRYCGTNLHNRKSNCHHIYPYTLSKDNSMDNLITFCIPCHSKIEYHTKLVLANTGGEEVDRFGK